MNLQSAAKKAQTSKTWNCILNLGLLRMVPFNRPHNFWVNKLTNNEVQVKLPCIKLNMNHVNGIHACAMATTSEYASGLLLLHRLNPKEFRIIMESISVKYHYQGKTTAFTKFILTDDEFEKEIINPLKSEDAIYKLCEVKTYDKNDNLLCTASVNWQIKNWKKVKTKV
jgi:hypothetical protein